jgi:toxin-antitoxin system PIN domain toxin
MYLYMFRSDGPGRSAYREWLEDLINSDQTYGCWELVLSEFLRVVTHPRVFNPPSSLSSALAFSEIIRNQPNSVHISPGPRHWDIFKGLCDAVNAKGNLIPDAYLAAQAIESGSEWITTDGDFGRFPGLNWRRPFQNAS